MNDMTASIQRIAGVDTLVRVTFFENWAASTKVEETVSLRALADRIRHTTGPDKESLPWLKLATFGTQRTDANCLRHDRNVLHTSGCEADYDGEQMTVQGARERLQAAQILSVVYTSPSHVEDAPRWRVLAPTSTWLAPEDRRYQLARLNGVLGGVIADESWRLSQCYYYGSVRNNPSHTVELIDGLHIDLHPGLTAGAIHQPVKPGPEVRPASTAYAPVADKRIDGFCRSVLDRLRADATEGQKHAALLRCSKALGGVQHAGGFTDTQAVAWLLGALPGTVKDWGRAAKTALDGLKYGRTEPIELPDREHARLTTAREANYSQGRLADASGSEPPPPPPPDDPGRPEGDGTQPDDLILSSKSPLLSARAMIRARYTTNGIRTLLHQGDTFYAWCGTHYIAATPEEVRASAYRFLDKAKQPTPEGKLAPFNPNKTKVSNIIEAAAAETQLASIIRSPTWLDDSKPHPAPTEIIACRNGLLHLPTRTLHPHDPAFYNLNALTFDYDADASPPDQWLDFLAILWEKDPESIDTLQELFGLLLVGDTSQQKLFMLVGPKRSGKGTIARVATTLLGQPNVCSPTLSSMADRFGMEPLIGKRLAVIADARLGGKIDQSVIVERLLSVSGEDAQTVGRKFISAWNGNLEVRFLLLTNELPRLTDVSGAMASRFIILVLTRSFYGQEDHGLGARLVPEMPGILNWAVAGWQRLNERGYFIPPASSSAAQRDMEDLSSPIGAFLRQRCIVEPGHTIDCAQLYNAWNDWCRDNGRDNVGTVQVFGRDLRAAVPDIRISRLRNPDGTEGRTRWYEGIGLGQ